MVRQTAMISSGSKTHASGLVVLNTCITMQVRTLLGPSPLLLRRGCCGAATHRRHGCDTAPICTAIPPAWQGTLLASPGAQMCGILALYNLDGTPVDPDLLRRLRDVMTHRGPDDAGLYTDGPLGLGHRRLSIVDLTPSGHQPMCNEDGSVWLVFNGEVYNYVELAVELERRGHRFRSRTDSEVIIHLYEEIGPKCVDQLNGMFAFVIWDARSKTLFGARDRVGIKPLYYYTDAARFVCASEVKAILEHPAVPRVPDPEGMAGWLFSGTPTGGRMLFV